MLGLLQNRAVECVPRDALSKHPHPCFILLFRSVGLVTGVRGFSHWLVWGWGNVFPLTMLVDSPVFAFFSGVYIVDKHSSKVSLVGPIMTLRLNSICCMGFPVLQFYVAL